MCIRFDGLILTHALFECKLEVAAKNTVVCREDTCFMLPCARTLGACDAHDFLTPGLTQPIVKDALAPTSVTLMLRCRLAESIGQDNQGIFSTALGTRLK